MTMIRNIATGRYMGKDTQFVNFEQDNYVDYKESNLRFPSHLEGSSEVTTWKMSKEELAAKYGK